MDFNLAESWRKLAALRRMVPPHVKSKEHLTGHKGNVLVLAWSCDGKYLATGSTDRTGMVSYARGDSFRPLHILSGHPENVDQLCWHPSSTDVVATSSSDKCLRLWDCRSGRCASAITTKGENINMAWSPDGNTICMGNKNDLLSFIDVRGQKIFHEEQFKKEVNEMQWHPVATNYFYLTTGDGHIMVFTWPDMKLVCEKPGHGRGSSIISIRFDPSGDYLATGSADACGAVYLTADLVPIAVVGRKDWPIRSLSFSHDSRLLAAGSEDTFIDVCYPETGDQVHRLDTRTTVFTLAFHPKRLLLAYTCDEKYDREKGIIRTHLYDQ